MTLFLKYFFFSFILLSFLPFFLVLYNYFTDFILYYSTIQQILILSKIQRNKPFFKCSIGDHFNKWLGVLLLPHLVDLLRIWHVITCISAMVYNRAVRQLIHTHTHTHPDHHHTDEDETNLFSALFELMDFVAKLKHKGVCAVSGS